MGQTVYKEHVTDALEGAMTGLAREAGVTMPSLMGAIVVSVHQSQEDGAPPGLHIATNLPRELFHEAVERLADRQGAGKVEPDTEGYASVGS